MRRSNKKRLIDANELIDKVDESKHNNPHPQGMVRVNHRNEHDHFLRMILDAPTVDAVAVVHAEWLDIRFDSMWRSMLATCSHCKVRGEVRVKSNECGFAVPDSDHCPHCGAKMDGGV